VNRLEPKATLEETHARNFLSNILPAAALSFNHVSQSEDVNVDFGQEF
jgi:hypothetical protein